jgi:hypothetical protein
MEQISDCLLAIQAKVKSNQEGLDAKTDTNK